MVYLMCGHSTANNSEGRHAHIALVDPHASLATTPCGRILSCCCCWVHTDCPPGTYGSDCLPCTPGSWCPGGKQAPITACGPNRFSAAAAKSAGDCYCVPGAIRAGIGWREPVLWCDPHPAFPPMVCVCASLLWEFVRSAVPATHPAVQVADFGRVTSIRTRCA